MVENALLVNAEVNNDGLDNNEPDSDSLDTDGLVSLTDQWK